MNETVQAALRVVALELLRSGETWLSHGSALFLHGWAKVPESLWTASSPRPRRVRAVPGGHLCVVACAASARFGLGERSVGPGLPIQFTNPERTLVDALRRPELCGGLAAVAPLIVRPDVLVDAGGPAPRTLDTERLVDYALRLGVGAVVRRLGFLLELRPTVEAAAVARLRTALTPTWTGLDPARPRGGLRHERWRLVVNVPPADLAAAVGAAPELWAHPPPPPAPPSATRPTSPSARAPHALASFCCRHDIWRAAVLDGALADLAGREGREAWLSQGDAGRSSPAGAEHDPGRSADGSAGAREEASPERVALLVDFHYKRQMDLRGLAGLEAELSVVLGRPVALRTMDDLVRRLARTVWRQAGLIYFRKGGGHRSSARAQESAKLRRARQAVAAAPRADASVAADGVGQTQGCEGKSRNMGKMANKT